MKSKQKSLFNKKNKTVKKRKVGKKYNYALNLTSLSL
jgi:hypothetical protein